jgi:X-X-X-Leu-X-X-Gly heptad repeat protein
MSKPMKRSAMRSSEKPRSEQTDLVGKHGDDLSGGEALLGCAGGFAELAGGTGDLVGGVGRAVGHVGS